MVSFGIDQVNHRLTWCGVVPL